MLVLAHDVLEEDAAAHVAQHDLVHLEEGLRERLLLVAAQLVRVLGQHPAQLLRAEVADQVRAVPVEDREETRVGVV